jgi:hypothetical protein
MMSAYRAASDHNRWSRLLDWCHCRVQSSNLKMRSGEVYRLVAREERAPDVQRFAKSLHARARPVEVDACLIVVTREVTAGRSAGGVRQMRWRIGDRW